MKNKEELNAIKAAIIEAATAEGIHPSQLTKAQLMKHTDVTDWELRKFGGLANIKNANFAIEEKKLAEIQDMKAVRAYISKLEKEAGNLESLQNRIMEELKTVVKPLKINSYKRQNKSRIKRNVNLVLSDLHIGSDITKAETGVLDFGRLQESRRLAKVFKEAIEYKEQYRDETELNVLLLGDIIQNSLHDMRDGAPLAEQVARAIHLLSQGFMHLAEHYPKVRVYCATGNHGRNTGRHQTRATHQKWDSIETIIYYALKTVFDKVENVEFHIPLTPYVTYEVFGKQVFATHGDTVFNPGMPGKNIQVSNLEEQTNRINASLLDDKEYAVFVVGHVHTGSITHLGNNSTIFTNGPLVPSDDYAVSIGLLEGNCGQWMFESVDGYAVGDCRYIRVEQKDDENESFDKLIKPFVSM